jgi:hypothetical protein
VPELSFQVEGAQAVPYAAAPLLAFKLRIGAAGEPVYSIALQCQIRIEPIRRQYGDDSREQLFDLFGPAKDWGRTVRAMLWTHAAVNVPAFEGNTVVDLPVPCTFDFNLAATKYFDALPDGEVPMSLLFSGTVFYSAEGGALQVTQIPWDREATYRLPVRVWRDMMNHYYPNCAWVALRKDVFDRLARFKSRGAYPSWEEALMSLLPPSEREAP